MLVRDVGGYRAVRGASACSGMKAALIVSFASVFFIVAAILTSSGLTGLRGDTKVVAVSGPEAMKRGPPYELPSPFYLHYVRFRPASGNMTLRFTDYLSILSGVQYLKPDEILVHGDAVPEGEYWDDLVSRKLIRHIFKNMTTNTGHRFGKPKIAAFLEHSADMAKLDILLDYGGVVADFDIFFVRGERIKDMLRKKQAVNCYGDIDGNNFGIAASHKDARYLFAWRQSYKDIYNEDWNFNQCFVSKYLSIVFHEDVYVMNHVCNNPHPDAELRDFFHDYGIIKWKDSAAIHSYERFGHAPIRSPAELMEGNLTTHKELFRTIYHNLPLPPADPNFNDEFDQMSEA